MITRAAEANPKLAAAREMISSSSRQGQGPQGTLIPVLCPLRQRERQMCSNNKGRISRCSLLRAEWSPPREGIPLKELRRQDRCPRRSLRT